VRGSEHVVGPEQVDVDDGAEGMGDMSSVAAIIGLLSIGFDLE